MTPEEYERLKEAEKEHLRGLKKLKETVRMLERQKNVSRAVSEMTSSMQEKLDEHADIMDKIAAESALSEARLEIAMEASEQADRVAQEIQDEEEVAKVRAKELVRQMKDLPGGAESMEVVDSKKEKTEKEESKHDELDRSFPIEGTVARWT